MAFWVVFPGFIGGAMSFAFIAFLYKRLINARTGTDIGHPKLDKLAAQIKSGSRAFLLEEYKYLSLFVSTMALIMFLIFSLRTGFGNGVRVALCFLCGSSLSALAGWWGMSVATVGNVRTTVACTKGTLNEGLQIAFTSGAVMGFAVVGLGISGLSIAYLFIAAGSPANVMQCLAGFGFGASSIALFARVAGGIFTKAADVGADLVGKIEAGIDEDDPHNPAVIADNVGDNVGDVAGMGADLFESYVGSIIASATLATMSHGGSEAMVASTMKPAIVETFAELDMTQQGKLALPFWLAGAGIIASIIGYFAVSTKEKGGGWNSNMSKLMWALEKGMYLAAVIFVGESFLIVFVLLPFGEGFLVWLCIVIGLVAGMMIGKITEYFTSFDYGPVISIKDRGITGPATVIIQGLGVGMISCAPPAIVLLIAILACNALDGLYGVSISAVGMLSTLGITLATDAYGPVADNAGGLAEMDPSIPKEVREKTDALDALGNTTAATGKGFAIGSAVLTAISLMAAFQEEVDPERKMDFTIGDPLVLSGMLFGGVLPMLFAALTMISVGKAAAEIIQEVRRQFNGGVPGLRECIIKASKGERIPDNEDVDPDSDRCVQISTRTSLREMIAPGAYAILAPLISGFLVGPRFLLGTLAGSIVTGCCLAIMMSNAGGAWDNSKKLCEKLKIKKTDQGKACVVGDTVGDPFKDTSGPALNILIKLMSMISLTIAPLIQGHADWQGWYIGVIPLAAFFVLSAWLKKRGILTWDDPLANLHTITVDMEEDGTGSDAPLENGMNGMNGMNGHGLDPEPLAFGRKMLEKEQLI
eukprot:GEMP01001389.1.p1 GENE.GEMP01001389.1~~GEMP01001389.1.p1  ORF type:complete len:817 (+),score=145.75 GEMP01001389.1:28-2478(+)